MSRMLRVAALAVVVLVGGMAEGRGQGGSAVAGLPAVIERGLTRFQTSGGEVAVENWTRGGPLERTQAAESEAAAVRKLEGLYGKYQGYSVIERIPISPASELFYLEIELEKGPIYLRIHVFDGRKDPRVVSLAIDASPERILPPHVLERKSRPR